MVPGSDSHSLKSDISCNIHVANMTLFKPEYHTYSGRVFLTENKVFGNVIKYSISCLRCLLN